MTSPNPSTTHVKIEAQVAEALRDELDRVAYEQSEPGEQLNRADVIREASRELIDRHDRNPEDVRAFERGSIDGEEVDA